MKSWGWIHHEVNLPKKPATIFLGDDGAVYWLGKTKLKQAFRLTQNAFNKLLQCLKKSLNRIFY